MPSFIQTQDLTKSYGELLAVDKLNLSIDKNEIFGLIGPNGAGKTTTVRMMTTLMPPTAGTAVINTFDIRTQVRQVQSCIGYVPQEVGVDEIMTGREHLILQGKLQGMSKPQMDQRISQVLELVGLTEAADRRTIEYSGGMRKLLDIAAGLLHEPPVLFLDEPTAGVDVEKRLGLWAHLKQLPEQSGTTIFLTTHFLEEADQLCDRVAIMNKGRIVVEGPPNDLKDKLGKEVLTLQFHPNNKEQIPILAERVKALAPSARVLQTSDYLKFFVENGEALVMEISSIVNELGFELRSLSIAKPTLDDVFLAHTEREMS